MAQATKMHVKVMEGPSQSPDLNPLVKGAEDLSCPTTTYKP